MTKTAREMLHNFALTYRVESKESRNQCLDQALEELEAIIRNEKLELLAEVRERVVGEYETEYSNLDGDAGYWEKHGRNGMREKQIAALTKLEAEL